MIDLTSEENVAEKNGECKKYRNISLEQCQTRCDRSKLPFGCIQKPCKVIYWVPNGKTDNKGNCHLLSDCPKLEETELTGPQIWTSDKTIIENLTKPKFTNNICETCKKHGFTLEKHWSYNDQNTQLLPRSGFQTNCPFSTEIIEYFAYFIFFFLKF